MRKEKILTLSVLCKRWLRSIFCTDVRLNFGVMTEACGDVTAFGDKRRHRAKTSCSQNNIFQELTPQIWRSEALCKLPSSTTWVWLVLDVRRVWRCLPCLVGASLSPTPTRRRDKLTSGGAKAHCVVFIQSSLFHLYVFLFIPTPSYIFLLIPTSSYPFCNHIY